MLPHHCILCGDRCTQRDLCAGCRADLPWLRSACRRCAEPLPAPGADECGRCLRHPPPQAATCAAFHYAFPVDQLLLKLKFGDSLPPGRVLGELLGEYLIAVRSTAPTMVLPDALVPVPLHPKRQRERGYNQAIELARPVAGRLGIPLRDWCQRTRATLPQSTLTGAERRRNLKGAFIADPRVAGIHVALIDDIYTTGNTIAAATHALLAAGATRIDAWCVARA